MSRKMDEAIANLVDLAYDLRIDIKHVVGDIVDAYVRQAVSDAIGDDEDDVWVELEPNPRICSKSDGGVVVAVDFG